MDNASTLKVALFCGGRGSATIIHELLRWSHIELTLIVNAYDDGLSTGALRNFISEMLGPSDFRKNLSYLIDPYSEGQYALKNLFEYRLPNTIQAEDMKNFIDILENNMESAPRLHVLQNLFTQLSQDIAKQVKECLQRFFAYANEVDLKFDFADCSVGNLIFSGAFLENNHDFNAAANAMAKLVSSRACLANVSKGENRILIALKENGELLFNEAQIVSQQSSATIRKIFLVPRPITQAEWDTQKNKTLLEKEAWLESRELLPQISPEAAVALAEVDIILFGPGTQHSSLFPSYRIANEALRDSPAPIKAFVMNLEADHDIQNWRASEVLNKALSYMGDANNAHELITHIFIDVETSLDGSDLTKTPYYKNALVIQDQFVNHVKQVKVHNGRSVVEKLLQLWDEKTAAKLQSKEQLDIFIDINKRSLAALALCEECGEMDWDQHFSKVTLTFNHAAITEAKMSELIRIKKSERNGSFPEINYFLDWLSKEKSEYLVLLTGDGEYRFRDVMLGIKLLEQSHFGAVFGSRNQSRLQSRSSLRAAYGEKKLMTASGFVGSFLISAFFALRFGMIFSDPLTGLRIFRRSKMIELQEHLNTVRLETPISIMKYFIKHNIEIAELPVSYRTFSGFTDPKWRIRRGLKNLLSTFFGGV